ALAPEGDGLSAAVGLVSGHGHGHSDTERGERLFIALAAALAIRYRDTDLLDWHEVSRRQESIKAVTRDHGRSSHHWRRPGWQRSRLATGAARRESAPVGNARRRRWYCRPSRRWPGRTRLLQLVPVG